MNVINVIDKGSLTLEEQIDPVKNKKLYDLAKKYIWWKDPKDAVADQNHFMAQIMTVGVVEDCVWLLGNIGEGPFVSALREPPVGVFNGKSWHFWHYKLGIASHPSEIPPLPNRNR